jgi:hypothetical protein
MSDFQPMTARSAQAQADRLQAFVVQNNLVISNPPQNLVQGQIQTLNVQNGGIILPNRTLILYSKEQPARRITAMSFANPAAPTTVTFVSPKASS